MPKETEIGSSQYRFKQTIWTVILNARDKTSPDYQEALNYLIGTYWKPVYFYVRRKNYDVETAKELTQSFFTVFLEKDFLKNVSREKGKFRTFILTALNHFLSKEREQAGAQKRGGGKIILPLEFSRIETSSDSYTFEPTTDETPEKTLNREWSLATLQKSLENLHQELINQSREIYFEVLKAYLTGQQEDQAATYKNIAAQLNLSENDVTNYLHYTRKRYRELIEEEIKKYVLDENELKEEIQELFNAVMKS
ncbi:MAG: hypothetical protein AAB019_09865 [Planctomycetota bacterium]